MKDAITAVFCDFDGTVTRRDVGYSLFHHFSDGKNDALLPDWISGRITTRECLLREAQMISTSKGEIHRFLDRFELDPGFPQFEGLCRSNGVDLIVVSDGLDFYIKHILKRFHLDYLPVIANHGIVENGSISIEFVHENRQCRRCGSCKGERIREYRSARGQASRIAFVGDGYSDACATKEADIVLAKKDLERFCLHNHIAYCKYNDFFDVACKLNELGLGTVDS
ncbi:MAG: MtnX-like HAD-IB family phosphatase [Candidatus Zixiibacteriota bacterium]